MRLIHFAVAGLCLALTVSVAIAEDKKSEKHMDPQAMMDAYKKLATPGEPHKLLGTMVGSWTTKSKSWMEPSQPPIESNMACEETMLLDGRFLQEVCTGEFVGQPFTGIGMTGYDNHTKKYVSTWMDSMGTGIMFMEGMASADGKTITQKGGYQDPIEGRIKLRAVTKLVDANTKVFEMHGTGKNGKEIKMMEITYARKQ